MIRPLLNLIAPHYCVGCITEGQIICDPCINTIDPAESSCYLCSKPTKNYSVCFSCNKRHLSRVNIYADYDGHIIELIYNLKFNRQKDVAKKLAEMLFRRFGDIECDAVSYVPTATKRVRNRGYDQSRLIAKEYARLSEKPFMQVLNRLDQSRQVGRGREQRGDQIQYRYSNITKDKRILLVDDVLTTGKSMKKASKFLRGAGAKEVIGLVVARVSLK